MVYSNLEIYNELKYIDNCFFGKGSAVIDEAANEYYKNNKPGILNYLIENKLVNMNTRGGRSIPFISAYGKDFLSKNKFLLWCDDFKNLFLFILTTLGVILTGIGVYYTYLSYFK